jgi:hypothetical protein
MPHRYDAASDGFNVTPHRRDVMPDVSDAASDASDVMSHRSGVMSERSGMRSGAAVEAEAEGGGGLGGGEGDAVAGGEGPQEGLPISPALALPLLDDGDFLEEFAHSGHQADRRGRAHPEAED